MGVDFIRERAKAFTRSWDRHRIELATRSLFTRDPVCVPRAALASTTTPRTISPGTIVVVRAENGGLVAYHELTPVAEFVDPPPDMALAIDKSGGCAKGEVTVVYTPTLLEITLCRELEPA